MLGVGCGELLCGGGWVECVGVDVVGYDEVFFGLLVFEERVIIGVVDLNLFMF